MRSDRRDLRPTVISRRYSCLAVVLALSISPCVMGAEVLSIEEIVKQQDQWSKMVEDRTPLAVEGRLVSLNAKLARFDRCPLPFRVVSSKSFVPIESQQHTLRVYGHLESENGKYFFVVGRFQEQQPDAERFESTAKKLKEQDFAGWYELADWAAGRGRFYKDDKLLTLSQSAYENGVRAERDSLSEKGPDAFLLLAEKARTLPVPDTLAFEMLFEGYFRSWKKTTSDGDQAALNALADRIAKNLPESKTPLTKDDVNLQKQFATRPVEFYREKVADIGVRNRLHRMLYASVVVDAITSGKSDDGRNGGDIANQIEERLPERANLAAQYREQEIQFRIGRISVSTRQEIIDLAEDLEKLDRTPEADTVKRKWLESRRAKMNLDDPGQSADLARDYMVVLDDKQSAADILLAAIRQAPESKVLQQMLAEIGYVRGTNGIWSPGSGDQSNAGDVNAMIRMGMSGTDVRKLLFSPTRITRIVSAGQVSEVWTYGKRGDSRIIVHLASNRRRSVNENKSDPKVISVFEDAGQ